MRKPEKEVKRLLKKPVHTKVGELFINQTFQTPQIQLDLKSFANRSSGSLFMFSPEEWVRVLEIIRVYLKKEKNSKKSQR